MDRLTTLGAMIGVGASGGSPTGLVIGVDVGSLLGAVVGSLPSF